MGINDLLYFNFIDLLIIDTMLTVLEELYILSVLDNKGLLIYLDYKIADFLIEPALAKVLIVLVDLGCSEELLSIIAIFFI